MLSTVCRQFHIVHRGQSLRKIAEYYSVSEYLLVQENGLKEEPFVGQILKIPAEKGNAYFVQEGDTKVLLCGSDERFKQKNGTDIFYIGMRVIL
jgi:hypothetical protein